MSYQLKPFNKQRMFWATLLAVALSSCTKQSAPPTFDELLSKGEFARVQQTIDSLKEAGSTQLTAFQLDSVEQIMHGIRRDFSLTGEELREQLQHDFPLAGDSLIAHWEKSGKLEMRIIEGEKRYFINAVPNLKRLLAFDQSRIPQNSIQVDPGSLTAFRLAHTKAVIDACNDTSNLVLPQQITFSYQLAVKPNTVPAGEVIRCWLPAPREGNDRQTNFQMMESDPKDYILAPKEYLQRTFYMEKTAVKDEPTVFSVRFSVQTKAQYFKLNPDNIQPYDTTSAIFLNHTSERPPQIVFSKEMAELAKRMVGDETNPLKKVEAIYTWISDSIPWASALEYGTIPNIPHYVLNNRHGDCGMHTLLFMTLARLQGIPVKWQSGFMLHPGFENLHDWCEVYYEGVGWVPLDQSFKLQPSDDKQLHDFYFHGIDAYRLIVNDDYGQKLYPEKKHPRSEPYDFQRGEVEWNGGNLFFDQWTWHMDVTFQ